jgi:hypothetical protein
MLNQYYKIPIQVKPHVAQYLNSLYGSRIIISSENPITMIVYAYLRSKKQLLTANSAEAVQQKIKQQTATINLLIQKRDQYRFGIDISKKNQVLLNDFFHEQITMHIHQLANAYQAIKKTRTAAIEYFCNTHGIDIEHHISMDALIKNDQRMAQHLKKIQQLAAIEKDGNIW